MGKYGPEMWWVVEISTCVRIDRTGKEHWSRFTPTSFRTSRALAREEKKAWLDFPDVKARLAKYRKVGGAR